MIVTQHAVYQAVYQIFANGSCDENTPFNVDLPIAPAGTYLAMAQVTTQNDSGYPVSFSCDMEAAGNPITGAAIPLPLVGNLNSTGVVPLFGIGKLPANSQIRVSCLATISPPGEVAVEVMLIAQRVA